MQNYLLKIAQFLYINNQPFQSYISIDHLSGIFRMKNRLEEYLIGNPNWDLKMNISNSFWNLGFNVSGDQNSER